MAVEQHQCCKAGGREKKRSWGKNFAQNPAENKIQGLP
jgi:hypothetical protein